MNKLLKRQLQKYLGLSEIPEDFSKLLNVISESYDHYEKDRRLIERSIEISSREMIELNLELKKEKEDLKKAQMELETFFQNIEEVLFSVDMVSYKVIQMSAGCEKMYGYSAADFFADGNLWRNVIHPEDAHIVEQQLEDLYKGEQIFNQYRIIHKDKKIRWLEHKIIPTLDERGRLIRIDGVSNDISNRKQTEQELEKSEKRANDLFHFSPQPMWVYDQETCRFIRVNKAAIEQYGYSEKEFLTMKILDIRPENEIDKTKKIIEELKKDPINLYKNKFLHRKKSGEVIEVEIFSSPISINNKNFRSVIAVDVTERNLYEKNIMKAVIKAQEDERYEIGGELHDNVCQILAMSKINLDLLKSFVELSKIPFFDACINNLSLALCEIRNLSHRLAPSFYNNSTLEGTFEKLINTFNIEEKIEIQYYFDKRINEYQITLEIQLNIYRILQEQMRNIQKYAKATSIKVGMFVVNENFRMRIWDNGIGFNPDGVKGGIGFANIKRRTELFSGKFEIESSNGAGCTIFIDIPLKKL